MFADLYKHFSWSWHVQQQGMYYRRANIPLGGLWDGLYREGELVAGFAELPDNLSCIQSCKNGIAVDYRGNVSICGIRWACRMIYVDQGKNRKPHIWGYDQRPKSWSEKVMSLEKSGMRSTYGCQGSDGTDTSQQPSADCECDLIKGGDESVFFRS